jgi:hypothetical protein
MSNTSAELINIHAVSPLSIKPGVDKGIKGRVSTEATTRRTSSAAVEKVP